MLVVAGLDDGAEGALGEFLPLLLEFILFLFDLVLAFLVEVLLGLSERMATLLSK